MRHRIRAAALICDGERVLLVEHHSPGRDWRWWVPPGGGVETCDASVFECARRETKEETGLEVELSHIAYVREFLEPARQIRHLELFIAARSWSGEPTLNFLPQGESDSDMITDARWIAKSELADIYVWPEELRDRFWDDYAAGFPNVHYLGVQQAYDE